jgi:hypothetical protein
MTLRCTKKALALLGAGANPLGNSPPTDDDWYMNLLWSTGVNAFCSRTPKRYSQSSSRVFAQRTCAR